MVAAALMLFPAMPAATAASGKPAVGSAADVDRKGHAATPAAVQGAPARSKIADDHQRRIGRVKWWNAVKGIGFITYQAAGGAYRDLFTQKTWVVNPFGIEQGDIVSFIVRHHPKGDRAVDVREIADA